MQYKSIFTFLIFTSTLFAAFGQEDRRDIARVKKMNGTEIYVMSEPLREYEVVFDLGGLLDLKSNVKAKSLLTGG